MQRDGSQPGGDLHGHLNHGRDLRVRRHAAAGNGRRLCRGGFMATSWPLAPPSYALSGGTAAAGNGR